MSRVRPCLISTMTSVIWQIVGHGHQEGQGKASRQWSRKERFNHKLILKEVNQKGKNVHYSTYFKNNSMFFKTRPNGKYCCMRQWEKIGRFVDEDNEASIQLPLDLIWCGISWMWHPRLTQYLYWSAFSHWKALNSPHYRWLHQHHQFHQPHSPVHCVSVIYRPPLGSH